MNLDNFHQLTKEVRASGARLIAVSKTKPVEDIQTLYQAGQRMFGENKVQEMASKYEVLPKDIGWHLIGHLQTNKVKYIASFVSLIHSVDSLKLLAEIDRQAERCGRVIDCLLQISISDEETKFGLSEEVLYQLLDSDEFKKMDHIRICGFMGMATNTDVADKIEQEFASLKNIFEQVRERYFPTSVSFKELSMGMTSDYPLALKHGATLVRVGSLIFGERN
ncbi:MAG: YggS family pyridoxal phosphate-dependent enzyme [Bacteroidetes bacterium]|nr:YggS family pyridoxal phosphate-dependent enzyme [Bacteroidota bacterium]